MIITEFSFREGELCLRLEGHAGQGSVGNDLVCAGVSTLVYALGATLEALWERGLLAEPPRVELASGRGYLLARPTGEGATLAEGGFLCARAGLEMLAGAYPDNVECSLS